MVWLGVEVDGGGYVWCSHSLAVGLSEAAMGGLVREIASALLLPLLIGRSVAALLLQMCVVFVS